MFNSKGLADCFVVTGVLKTKISRTASAKLRLPPKCQQVSSGVRSPRRGRVEGITVPRTNNATRFPCSWSGFDVRPPPWRTCRPNDKCPVLEKADIALVTARRLALPIRAACSGRSRDCGWLLQVLPAFTARPGLVLLPRKPYVLGLMSLNAWRRVLRQLR